MRCSSHLRLCAERGREDPFALMCSSSLRNLEVGGLENISHTKHLSENIFPTKSICVQFLRPNIVGGYMKGVD
jgi:hypothetical protein